MQLKSAFEALANLHSHDRVFIHSVAAAPHYLIDAMMEHAHRLEAVEIVQLHTEGAAPYAHPEMSRHFTVNAFFIGENIREAVSDGRAEYMPVFLSKVPQLFKKGILPVQIVTGFVMGSKKLYDFVHDNPSVVFLDIAYVNDTNVIRRNPHVVAKNSAIEIDMTGHICADSIGRHIYSGVGGQMDFIRGASLSENGKPIIAMPSFTANGESKIVATLKQGAGIVTTRAHAHYIVTEYGIADVYGKNIKQRCKALIDIAHPDHREMLEKSAFSL